MTGDVGIVSTGATTVNSVGGVLSTTITTVASSVNSATATNTANTIVSRDGSGGFSAGAITATSASLTNLRVTGGTLAAGSVLTSDANGNATWGTNGLYSLNGITSGTHSLTTGNSGTDFNISSSGSTHTFNLPDASATARGAVTTGTQTFAGAKTFDSDISVRGIKIGFGGGNITSNIAIGTLLSANTSGYVNLAVGSGALNANTTGAANTAFGINSLNSSTSSNYNSAFGYQALIGNTEGSDNTGVGKAALGANTTGSKNTGIGFEANVGASNLTNATAIGAYAKVSASNTIQLGADGTGGSTAVTNVKTSGTLTAGTVTYPNTHGSSGQVLSTTGSGTLTWTTPISTAITGVGTITTTSYANGATVSGNSLILAAADGTNGGVVTTGAQTFAGAKTFSSDIIANTVSIGLGKTSNGTSNAANTAVGSSSLNANTTGQRNAAFGYFSLNANTSGLENTAFGYQTLRANTIGSSNLAFGQNALSSNTEGGANTAMGNAAMESNLTGGSNTAVGSQALNKNKNSYNTAVGQYSMFNNVNGSYNTALGASALQGTTGTYNTGIGYNASVATGDGVTNATAIGNGASALASNTIQLGNTSVTSVVTSGTLSATGAIVGTLRVTGGSPGTGKVLTSDGSGNATWAAGGITGVGSIGTATANGASVSGTNLILAPADATNGGILTSGTQTIGGEKRFDKAVTNRVAYPVPSNGTTIDFSQSNLAYTGATPGNTFTLQNIKDGGTYTLAVQGSGTGTSQFQATNFNFTSLGNYAATSGKHTIYTFVVMGSTVYFSMVSAQ